MVERALVTGGARGIGRAISQSLLEAGIEVTILDKVAPDFEGACNFIEVDFEDEVRTIASLQEALQSGAITRLVNNVGVVKPALLEDSTLEEYYSVMSVNVRAAILSSKTLLPGMREAGFGRIVNISSRTVLGKALRTNYSASKGALVSLARTWALELADSGITANVVCPGPIRTELYNKANPPDSPRTIASLSNIPLGRMGEPSDIARAVMFFLDTSASFITGQTLHVCGGTSVGRVDF
tara:strand:- start:46628 stop:47347 length:720 start_codon:yes stop_codon:yes gene_type:complete